MKQLFFKISSFLMAIVVLFSTMSFSIETHYCGDTMVDTAIFHKLETCGMEMKKSTDSSDCNVTIKDCCTDEQISIEGQDELNITFDTLAFDQQLFLTSFVFSYNTLFNSLEENAALYRDYITPLVIRQIYKLDETYII
ncbi:hypothetical protein JBL43_13240 [Aureibaculum sp. A20]|uniref:Secreted protein n=1 Tax=Aureibaculum flavum TaxID=2795986 RepID=A0ABS0WTB5_9FLAO|nr:hypothetical protein [Aureibaculum flavum]MBJ2175211.1 hypothetical protein [Aureibaculum flavum]